MFTWFWARNSRPDGGWRWGFLILPVLLLSACGTDGFSSRALSEHREGLPAPTGVVSPAENVDGLIVGHRLMASGEYELALKAYHRAAGTHGLTVDVLSAMGSANLKLGRLHQSHEMLRIALKKDDRFVPAWNNLGVVLQSQGKIGEAKRVFQTAYALDNGNSDQIRDNLTKVIAILERNEYHITHGQQEFELVRRGNGRYLLLRTPDSI